MRAVPFLSPAGRLRPQPFVYGACAVYLAGAASQLLTAPDVIARGGLWPFIAVQLVLIWIWLVLHSKRLHDAGHSIGPAVGVAVLYILSIALLLIVADSFFNTSDGPMGNANATGALELILLVYVVETLLGSMQYDLAWAVVAILIAVAIVPIGVSVVFTVWAATRRPTAESAIVEAS